jgi:hypothetical protein
VTARSIHAVRRPSRQLSRWLAGTVFFVVLALFATLLQTRTPAVAAEVDPVEARALVVADLMSGGPSVRRAAETALTGSDADLQAYAQSERSAAQAADERAAAQVLAGMDGPAMRNAALAALDKSQGDVRNFVSWELIFSKRPEDPLPAIKHAVFKG